MQPSREAFSVALAVNMVRLYCSLFSTIGEEAGRFEVLGGLRQLGRWNRLVWGTGKDCAWYMIAMGQSICKRRLLKRSANSRGTFIELKAGAHLLCQTYCVHSPKQSSLKGPYKYTSAASLVACEVEDTGFSELGQGLGGVKGIWLFARRCISQAQLWHPLRLEARYLVRNFEIPYK